MKHLSFFLLLALAPAAPTAAAPVAAAAPAANAPAGSAPVAQQAAGPTEKAFAVSVRSASLSEVLARVSSASHVRLTASGPAADQRVTLSAPRVTVSELQDALRELLRLRVSRRGAAAEVRSAFTLDPRLQTQAEAWRLRQADAVLQAVQRTASAFAAGREAETVAAIQARFRRERSEFPETAQDAITADYLRQSLLLRPLTSTMHGLLVQSSGFSLPVAWLAPADQALLAAFAQGGPGRAALAVSGDEYGLSGPRTQYRLLYGDRWTDRMLLAQVGAPGSWSSAMLPAILFPPQDASSLYPQASDRPDDPDVWRRLPPRFETRDKEWDALLIDLAHTMQIKLAADSYSRPWIFNTDQPLPEIAGIPLRAALDRLCRQHGYFWWKQNGWYFLRSRTWVEESRVAVPDRLTRGWLNSIRDHGAMTQPDLAQMATLSDEQLLTLELQFRTPGDAKFLGPGFDPDNAVLLANALQFFRSLPPAQQELAMTTDGLPALWLPPTQQNLFAAVAAQYGASLFPEEADRWRFRILQEFAGGNTGAAPGASVRQGPLSGRLMAEWRFGSGQPLRASLTLSGSSLLQRVESANPSDAR